MSKYGNLIYEYFADSNDERLLEIISEDISLLYDEELIRATPNQFGFYQIMFSNLLEFIIAEKSHLLPMIKLMETFS